MLARRTTVFGLQMAARTVVRQMLGSRMAGLRSVWTAPATPRRLHHHTSPADNELYEPQNALQSVFTADRVKLIREAQSLTSGRVRTQFESGPEANTARVRAATGVLDMDLKTESRVARILHAVDTEIPPKSANHDKFATLYQIFEENALMGGQECLNKAVQAFAALDDQGLEELGSLHAWDLYLYKHFGAPLNPWLTLAELADDASVEKKVLDSVMERLDARLSLAHNEAIRQRRTKVSCVVEAIRAKHTEWMNQLEDDARDRMRELKEDKGTARTFETAGSDDIVIDLLTVDLAFRAGVGPWLNEKHTPADVDTYETLLEDRERLQEFGEPLDDALMEASAVKSCLQAQREKLSATNRDLLHMLSEPDVVDTVEIRLRDLGYQQTPALVDRTSQTWRERARGDSSFGGEFQASDVIVDATKTLPYSTIRPEEPFLCYNNKISGPEMWGNDGLGGYPVEDNLDQRVVTIHSTKPTKIERIPVTEQVPVRDMMKDMLHDPKAKELFEKDPHLALRSLSKGLTPPTIADHKRETAEEEVFSLADLNRPEDRKELLLDRQAEYETWVKGRPLFKIPFFNVVIGLPNQSFPPAWLPTVPITSSAPNFLVYLRPLWDYVNIEINGRPLLSPSRSPIHPFVVPEPHIPAFDALAFLPIYLVAPVALFALLVALVVARRQKRWRTKLMEAWSNAIVCEDGRVVVKCVVDSGTPTELVDMDSGRIVSLDMNGFTTEPIDPFGKKYTAIRHHQVKRQWPQGRNSFLRWIRMNYAEPAGAFHPLNP